MTSSAGTPRLLRGRTPAVLALLIITGVIVCDIVVADDRMEVTSMMIAAPLLCGVTTSPAVTRRVAVLASAAAAAAFVWGTGLGTWRYWVPLAVVVIGSLFAVAMAIYREQLRRDAGRMRVLADVAEVANGDQPVQEIARAITVLLVPRLVDLCAIDLIGADGRLRRLAAAARAGGQADALLRRTIERDDRAAGGQLPAHTRHEPSLGRAGLRALARDEDERHLFEQLGLESAVVVVLAPRGAPLGTLTLATCRPRARWAGAEDREYAETLAGRVGLALDNAALSAELSTAEQQLQVILASVDAAVTVRDRNGRMVYANQAAADLLKLPDPAAVLGHPPGALMARFDVYTEAGDPVALTDLPGTRLLTGETAPAAMTVRNVIKETGEERWLLNKASAVEGPDGRVLLAVSLIEDVTESKRSEIAQRLLAQAARTLVQASESDLSPMLQAIADAAVPDLADWAGVDLIDPDGTIRTCAVAHRDPDKVRLGWTLRARWPLGAGGQDALASVIRTGEPQLVHEITDDALVRGARDAEHLAILREVGLNSAMIAPIRAGARILGALSFVSSTSRRFDGRDLELACDLGRQAGIVIDSAELQVAQTHIAQTLQAGLVPESLPPVAGWDVSSAYRAAGRANDVGGDFYDLLTFEGGWAAIIGDVVGKGAEAAALTARARHTLAAIIETTGDCAYGLRVLNRRLRQRSADCRNLCTVAAVVVTDDDHATIFSAGHPLPLLRRAASVAPVGRASPMLGYIDDLEIVATVIELAPGDQLVLYTDGVLDAIGRVDRFGESRLLETVARLADGDPAMADRILGAVDGFLDREQTDDIAIMSLTRAAVPAGRAARPARA